MLYVGCLPYSHVPPRLRSHMSAESHPLFLPVAVFSLIFTLVVGVTFYSLRMRRGSRRQALKRRAIKHGWVTTAKQKAVRTHSRRTRRDADRDFAYTEEVYIVTYSYTVYGREYLKVAQFSERGFRYMDGQDVEVYYDARNPEKAVLSCNDLKTDHQGKTLLLTLLLMLVTLFACTIATIPLMSE